MYVEEALGNHFQLLLSFLHAATHAAAAAGLPEGQPPPDLQLSKADAVIKHMSANWNTALEHLHRCAPCSGREQPCSLSHRSAGQ